VPAIPEATTAQPPAALAKGALRRLASARLEPTPENYARAYAEEAGELSREPAAPAWGALVERVVRQLERGGRHWTVARRKDSLQRVLEGNRRDDERLAQRLRSLLEAWEADRPRDEDEPLSAAAGAAVDVGPSAPGVPAATTGERATHKPAVADGVVRPAARSAGLVRPLAETVGRALEQGDERGAAALAHRFTRLADEEAASRAGGAAVAQWCAEAQHRFGQRHELARQLRALCSELTRGLVELTEDPSWSRGQCEALQAQLDGAVDVRGVRAASAMLAETRARQAAAQRERQAARTALKQVLAGMVGEVGALQQQAGGFESAIERHVVAVEAADSLEGLTTVVQAMLADSRQLRSAIGASHERLQHGSTQAAALEARVRELEADLRRLSDEACTDALTQVANRRGLEQLFAEVSGRAAATGAPLAVGLIDIDNFKKLNDRLGHAAGDVALKALASEVSGRLRAGDHVARFGGEEFVVLLSAQDLPEARQTLTRLQRALSASLFLHEGEEVFVTFSAGVTLWRAGEALDAAVERADTGLYEAKRTGKNRTCAV
jgi:diguanylate cyclase